MSIKLEDKIYMLLHSTQYYLENFPDRWDHAEICKFVVITSQTKNMIIDLGYIREFRKRDNTPFFKWVGNQITDKMINELSDRMKILNKNKGLAKIERKKKEQEKDIFNINNYIKDDIDESDNQVLTLLRNLSNKIDIQNKEIEQLKDSINETEPESEPKFKKNLFDNT